MATGVTKAACPRSVTATVNYVSRIEGRPRFYVNAAPQAHLDARMVAISDVRTWPEPADLDGEGFTLVRHKSAVRDFLDLREVSSIYPAEIEQLLCRLVGADRVVLKWPRILRSSQAAVGSMTLGNSGPARFVHSDYSDATSRIFAAGAVEDFARVRCFAHYNIWRAISPPPQDSPLAVCDARSIKPEDLVIADAIYDPPDGDPEYRLEGYAALYDPRHRWCYYSDMTIEEVLVFKAFDSEPGRAVIVPHTAFDDPTCPPGTPPRASIDMRALALWY